MIPKVLVITRQLPNNRPVVSKVVAIPNNMIEGSEELKSWSNVQLSSHVRVFTTQFVEFNRAMWEAIVCEVHDPI